MALLGQLLGREIFPETTRYVPEITRYAYYKERQIFYTVGMETTYDIALQLVLWAWKEKQNVPHCVAQADFNSRSSQPNLAW